MLMSPLATPRGFVRRTTSNPASLRRRTAWPALGNSSNCPGARTYSPSGARRFMVPSRSRNAVEKPVTCSLRRSKKFQFNKLAQGVSEQHAGLLYSWSLIRGDLDAHVGEFGHAAAVASCQHHRENVKFTCRLHGLYDIR